MQQELELKALIPDESSAFRIRQSLFELATFVRVETHRNHYFTGGDFEQLLHKVIPLLKPEDHATIKTAIRAEMKVSVRTREINSRDTYLVLKFAPKDGDAINGGDRIEIERKVDIPLHILDTTIMSCGYEADSFWSRQREIFRGASKAIDYTICLDFNAGYGWMLEVEALFKDKKKSRHAENVLHGMLHMLELAELPKDRLDRMYAFYKANWVNYYGTNDTFVIE